LLINKILIFLFWKILKQKNSLLFNFYYLTKHNATMKNLFLIVLILFSFGAVAQNKKNENKNVKKSNVIVSSQKEEKKSPDAGNSSTVVDQKVREKDQFPANVKAGPAIFYVEDDKPVDKPNWKKKKI